MKIKLQKSISDYKYLLMFDLASRVSGVCLWDIQLEKPIKTFVIKVGTEGELQVADLYRNIDSLFCDLQNNGILSPQILVYKEAMPVQLRGGSSTVQTFISLARSHGILDLYTYTHGIAMYDYIGIYPASTHSYLKKINGWDSKHKIEKADTKEFVEKEYSLGDLTFDEADAIFLAKTFVDVKWNKDLDEEIKSVKRHIKELKSDRSIKAYLEEIKRLEKLKIT